MKSYEIEEDEQQARMEERRRARQRALREKRRRQRRRRLLIRRAIVLGILLLILIGIIVGAVFGVKKLLGRSKDKQTEQVEEITDGQEDISLDDVLEEGDKDVEDPETDGEGLWYSVGESPYFAGYAPDISGASYLSSEEMTSEYAILVNLDTGNVVAQKEAQTRISPASMTKILTVLVAAEHVRNLDDTIEITIEMTDYAFVHDCAIVGWSVGEVVTVRDLLYGTILPSGGDAAAALATYVAGDMDTFVGMMNDKLAELGLSGTTHFTNPVGLYDENHYSTMYDMAMILKAAIENPLAKEALTAHTYTTTATPEHPDGIIISNWFLRRIEDKDTHGEVVCAKTGFVAQSGSCAASYQVSNDGTNYIAVTGNAHSSWRCIYDHVAIYDIYTN